MKLQHSVFRFEHLSFVMMSGLIFAAVLSAGGRQSKAEDGWQAGVARVVITPDEPMWLSGYGGRDHAAEGKVTDLFARAAALRDASGETAVFVSLDLIGVPIRMVNAVSGIVEKRLKVLAAD